MDIAVSIANNILLLVYIILHIIYVVLLHYMIMIICLKFACRVNLKHSYHTNFLKGNYMIHKQISLIILIISHLCISKHYVTHLINICFIC